MSELKSEGLNESEKVEIVSFITEHMKRADFAMYMNYCIKKWKRLEVDLQIVDTIMTSVCKHWDISREELMAEKRDKKLYEPRAMLYYIVKKQINNISYSEIGDIFNKQKSSIYKLINEMTFLVEQRAQKDMVISFQSINDELTSKIKKASFIDNIKS